MVAPEREIVITTSRPYIKLLAVTAGSVAAVAAAGFISARALEGSPAMRCLAFVFFGVTAFVSTTLWWTAALDTIGHTSSSTIPARIWQSLCAILALVACVTAGEYGLFIATQSRTLEALVGIAVSLMAFSAIGKFETRHLSPPTPEQVTRLRSVARMFVLVALLIVLDIAFELRQTRAPRFETLRDIEFALAFASAPAVLVGAWFVRRRYTNASQLV